MPLQRVLGIRFCAVRRNAGHVELALPVYLALHLHERLVLGVGPELATDLRIAALSDAAPNGRYVRGGSRPPSQRHSDGLAYGVERARRASG